MTSKSFLLALSGSQQCRWAAEIGWTLAKQCGARVIAQHVVDSHAAWEFFGFTRPGFIGSGPFVRAHEIMVGALRDAGNTLLGAYEQFAESYGVDSETVLDEGSTVDQICRRAVAFDLVIAGHTPLRTGDHWRWRTLERTCVAEGLAHSCPRPLLIVQDCCQIWEDVRIIVPVERINERYLNSCLTFAGALNASATVACVGTGVEEEPPLELIADLIEADPRLSQCNIEVQQLPTWEMGERAVMLRHTDIAHDASAKTLVVMPTYELEGRRTTLFGSDPGFFIRQLELSALLLWPEEWVDQSWNREGNVIPWQQVAGCPIRASEKGEASYRPRRAGNEA